MNFEHNSIVPIDIQDEMKDAYLDYSMSVIVGRALPDVRDGLKPVHRRILYTLFENGIGPDKAYRKCADTVGTVLGRYHPHGDASVYDALVRLAQDFSMRYPLVDGHGNFGSVDGDPAAAYRYTESRMSKISTEMLTDIEKDTVDFVSNYDDRLKEPEYLPAKFPNLLVNGSTGIAVGMATNIPPHNLSEVIDGMCHLIDNPEAELDELMEHIKGPDFPTSGIIMGRAGIRAAYGTGRGRILVRARTEIEEDKNGRFKILVTEIPYQVNKARLIESISEMAKEKRIEGISFVEDHSDRKGMCIVISLKKDASPQIVLNKLFSYTQMQVTFGIIMLAIVNGEPKVLTLKQVLEHYIKFQEDVIYRRSIFEIKKAKERAHILEGLLIALDFIDEVIKILRSSKSIPEGKEALMNRFALDEIQAQAIVSMRLGQLTGLERAKIEEEMAALKIKIADLEDIIANQSRRLLIVKEEALVIRNKYQDERLTEIATVSGEVDIEDLIPVENCITTVTTFGYVKRQKVDTFTAQKRGGRGITGMTRRDEDVAMEMFTGSTHDFVLFFTNLGRVYRIKNYEIPESTRTSKGMNIANLLPISTDEKVTSVIKVSEFSDDKYLVMVTKNGIMKRIKLNDINTARKGGLIAISLDDDDQLNWVRMTDGQSDILVATKKGYAIRFKESDARILGRTARGVKSISLREDDCVADMDVISNDSYILTVSETGYGRLSKPSDYRVQNRAGKGLKNYHVERFGDVAAVKVVDSENEDLIIISSNGIIIRLYAGDVRVCSRPSKGVKVMRIIEEDNKVVTVATAPHEEDQVTDKIEVSPDEDPNDGADDVEEIEVEVVEETTSEE